jgi:MOSC domain-containing protein YiiM
MAEILAVCRVTQLLPDSGSTGVTAIDKRPVAERLRVRPLGVRGDVQADRAHHGGASKALYAYADEDAAFWAAELGRPIPAGLFGENLRTAGLDVNGAGDVVRVLSRPGHGVSIASWFTGADAAQADALEAAEAAGLLTLVPEMRESVEGVRSRGLLVLDK